jgi:hypothetical protein
MVMGVVIPAEVLERKRREREARRDRWPPEPPLFGDGPAEVTTLEVKERKQC